MLRAEETGDGTDVAGRAQASAVGEGRAATTAGAMAEAVRRAYGETAVVLPGVAEGLAAAGRIAGTLPAKGVDDALPSTPRGAWVHHRVAPHPGSLPPDFAFECVAETPQQAADLVLVARLAAGLLGRPGVCTVPESAAGAIGFVLPPADGTFDVGGSSMARAETLAAVHEAFALVADATGRPVGPLAVCGRAQAGIAVVAEAGLAAPCAALAERLAALGFPSAVITLALVRPVDAAAVARAVQGCRLAIAVVPEGDRAARARALAALAAAGESLRIEIIEAAGNGAPAPSPGLLEALGCGAPRWSAATAGLELPARRNFAAAPPGPWAEPVLLSAAVHAAAGDPRCAISHAGRSGEIAGVSVVPHGATGGSDDAEALVVPAAEAPRLDPAVWTCIAPGGRVLLVGVGGSIEQTWATLPIPARRILVARAARLAWFDAGPVGAEPLARPPIDAAGLGAALAHDDRPCLTAEALGEGSAEARTVATQAGLGSAREAQPTALDAAAAAAWRRALRAFHRDGVGAHSAADPWAAGGLRPIGLASLLREAYEPGTGVLVTPSGEGPKASSFAAGLAAAVASFDAEGDALGLAGPLTMILGRLVERATEARGGIAPLAEVLDEACARLPEGIDASPAGAVQAARESERLRARLGEGTLVALDGRAPVRLCVLLERHARRRATAAVAAEMLDRAAALEDMLRVDDALAPEGSSPGRLASSLGSGAARLDVDALAGSLPRARGSKRLEPARRARMEQTRAILLRWGASAAQRPEVVLVVPRDMATDGGDADKTFVHEEPLEAAIGLFDGLVAERLAGIRALRAARLDLEGRYDADLHDAALAALDARGLADAETGWLPSIVVLETGARLRGRHLASLSRLIRSGRPVRIVVVETLDDLREGTAAEGGAAFHEGLGYLAVAHREAFVVQTTVARPDHLAAGLARLARFRGPALAVVAAPRPGAGRFERGLLEAALAGRETPCFAYDPSAGESWAERFDLAGNPMPERACPEFEATGTGRADDASAIVEAFTAAHAAAADPERRAHFRVIPRAAWDDTQIPIAAWLDLAEDERHGRLPVLHALDPSGALLRVAMTWAMAHACRDRRRAWRILGELAGYGNEHARRSAESARLLAERAAAEARGRLEAEHAEALERMRVSAATETVDRIVAALLGNAVAAVSPLLGAAAPPGPAPSGTVAEPAPSSVAAAPAPVEEEPEPSAEPWVEAALCTTCNECTNLNPKLFRYNANKQATIADPAAGTFEDLVKAAEKCPSRCIHPGAPRAGDATANPELVARAAKFR